MLDRKTAACKLTSCPLAWSPAGRPARPLEKIIGPGLHPCYKLLDFRMRKKGFGGTVLARQFGFRKQRVDLAMTNPMHRYGIPTAFHLRYQVVLIALRARYRSSAQWAMLWRAYDVPAGRLHKLANHGMTFDRIMQGIIPRMRFVPFGTTWSWSAPGRGSRKTHLT